jgi:cytidine deaminase
MNLLSRLIPFIVIRYIFYLIPMDLEMAFVDSTIGVHGAASFVFAFLLKTGGMFCTIVTKRGRCYMRCGTCLQALTKYELATNIQTFTYRRDVRSTEHDISVS